MIPALVESRPGARRRWWGLVVLIFIVQVALIFWLSDSGPSGPRPAVPAFTFKLPGSGSTELLALTDPTLFVLPHRQTAPELPPIRTPPTNSPPTQWPEPTNTLLFAVDRLGSAFRAFIKSNEFNARLLSASPLPALTLPDLAPQALFPEHSALRLEGELARRRLRTPLLLPSQTNSDILAPSVVRVAVDADGRPVSPTLLSKSGSVDADQYAVAQARAARFEPLRRNPAQPAPSPAEDLSWGRMVFEWHTLPPPPTNAPELNP